MAIRVLDYVSRDLQRLGYLKYLVARSLVMETGRLETVGKDLLRVVVKRVPVKLERYHIEYIQRRLTDRVYTDLRKRVLNDESRGKTAKLELQDAYLSAPDLLSKTGKLVLEDWRKYPLLATSLGLVRKGTYSALVRGQVLTTLVPKEEMEAFQNYAPEHNPLRLSTKQRILFLYSFVENDGNVLKRLYPLLLKHERNVFTDRDAGEELAEIFRQEELSHRKQALSGAERERLARLLKVADSIDKWRGRSYTGGGAIHESVKVRLEPFVDMGILEKLDPFKYEYAVTEATRDFFSHFSEDTDIEAFLSDQFFEAARKVFRPTAKRLTDEKAIVAALYEADRSIRSPLGYSPIEDLALLAGIQSLVQEGHYFDIAYATQILKDVQKAEPDLLRFNVDRMGRLTYVKFLREPSAPRKAR